MKTPLGQVDPNDLGDALVAMLFHGLAPSSQLL
jgi:hypothetical protein